MKIRLLTITHKSPAWIQAGYQEYVKRLPAACTLELLEIAPEKRGSNTDIKRITAQEGDKMMQLIKPAHHAVALDVKGELWSTAQLAQQLANWQQAGRTVDLLVGGADGLAPACVERAQQSWSLSPLTFPHALVKLLIAEQVYRALSILNKHPYHR